MGAYLTLAADLDNLNAQMLAACGKTYPIAITVTSPKTVLKK
jgi:hypothetical protein